MTHPRLSICIPTSAGREAMLAKNLPHTIEVAKRLDAEIVISPNRGTADSVKAVLPVLFDSGVYFRLLDEPSVLEFGYGAVGMIANLNRAYMAAEGEYCFPLGDDDSLSAEYIHRALGAFDEVSIGEEVTAIYTPYLDRADGASHFDPGVIVRPPIGGFIDNFQMLLGRLTDAPRFAPEAPIARTEAMKAAISEAPPGIYFGFAQLGGLLKRGRVIFDHDGPATYTHINHGANNAWKFAIENVEPMRAAWEWLVYKACQERGQPMNRDEKAWWADHIAIRMTEYYALAAEGLRREGRDPGQYDWRAELWG